MAVGLISSPVSPAVSSSAALAQMPDPGTAAKDPKVRAMAQAQQFEQVYLNTMLSQMFSTLPTEGAFHGGLGEETFRGFLVDEYAKTITRAGGVGIAKPVYDQLLRLQEGRAS